MTHLLGNHAAAIKGYLTLRLWCKTPPAEKGVVIPEEGELLAAFLALVPRDIRQMHRKAAEDAMFWMAVCHCEQGRTKYRSALETLKQYLRRYPDGSWIAAARYLRALMFVATDRLDDAIEELDKTYSSDPQHDGYQILIGRWKSLAAAKASKADH